MADVVVIEGDRVECALPASYELGEGSLWTTEVNGGAYLHVDILGGERAPTVSVHNPDMDACVTYRLPSTVGSVVPVVGGTHLLVSLQKGPAFLDLATGATRQVASVEADVPLNRTNDAKCGPDGRYYFGTMHGASVEPRPPTGSLYRLDHDGTVSTLLTGVTVSNGLAWSADGKTVYYIDTPTRVVQAFDFDAATGAWTNGRVAFAVPAEMGNPDGCTMDSEGKLWIAMWGGWQVLRFDVHTGAVLAKVKLPTAHVSSVAFGGPGLDDMYITTAKEFMGDAERAAQPSAGHVFRVRASGFTGVPSCAFRPSAALRASGGLPPVTPKRVGMVTELREECLAEYLRVHSDGHPGVRDLLVKYHLRNFNIFLQRLQGRLYEFAYYEYTGSDFDGDMKRLDAEPRNAEWHVLCDPMQTHPLRGSAGGTGYAEGGDGTGDAWQIMQHVFLNA